MKKQNTKWKQLMGKVTAVALSLAMTGALLTGCGSNKASEEKITVKVGALKGATTLGLLPLQDKAANGGANENYEFSMMTAADELLPLMIKGELDIALLPSNVASVLYQKTNGGVTVIDINTLGVLYMVSGDSSVSSVADLAGKTIYLTGKGTTPDYVLHYILNGNGIDADQDCTLEYRSEATEVAALLAENPDAIGLLPQPFVTAACAQNDALSVIMDMNAEWEKLQGENGSRLVTGVTVVRNEFLQEHENAVAAFMEEHKASAESMNTDVENGAKLAVASEIIAKEPIALKAIPKCNITYIDGNEMKQALSGYLQQDDFYYIAEK